jgi:hypothetical protein
MTKGNIFHQKYSTFKKRINHKNTIAHNEYVNTLDVPSILIQKIFFQ